MFGQTINGGAIESGAIEEVGYVTYQQALNTFIDTGLKAEDGSFYYVFLEGVSGYDLAYKQQDGTLSLVNQSSILSIQIGNNGNIEAKTSYNWSDWYSQRIGVIKIH